MAFAAPEDIANLAAVYLGQPRFSDFTSNEKMALESAFAYDKLRQAELERNLWRFATRRVVLRKTGIDTVLWTPAAWASGVSQSAGMVLSYAPSTGIYANQTFYWQLSAAETTSATPDADPLFHRYTGPLAIDLYDTGTASDGTTNSTYQTGEVVLVPAAYAGGTTYAKNDVVRSSTTWYVSLAGSNVGHAVTDTTWWTPWTSTGRTDNTYGVTASNSPIPLTYPTGYALYVSLFDSNEDNPVSATGNWLSLGGTVASLRALYPMQTRANAFYLPSGFLKRAPTNPKDNQAPYLGVPHGVSPEDWEPEGAYLITTDPGPLTLRFVADVIDVPRMNPLFCTGLAARIAMDLCESITTATAKMVSLERTYRRVMTDARMSNAIEIGPITPVENRLVVARR